MRGCCSPRSRGRWAGRPAVVRRPVADITLQAHREQLVRRALLVGAQARLKGLQGAHEVTVLVDPVIGRRL
jgi:hypothetical protein